MKKIKKIKKYVIKNKINTLIVFSALIGFFVFSSFFTYLYFANDLKTKDSIMNRNDTGIVLTDRNDEAYFTFYSARTKTFVPLDEIPEHTKQAIIAAEDQNFYSHPGFSIEGIVRATIRNFSENDVVAGGSTITQQLVKNALLTPRRSFLRKFQEVILAQEIERRYSKDEILEMYLNSVYFGNGAFGIEDASERYFGKPASRLTLAESSLLVGILPAPSAFSPISGSDEVAKSRQKYVLENMVKKKYISRDDQQKALNAKLLYTQGNDDVNSIAPHFAVMVRDELIRKYGEEKIIRSGYNVKTTIDLELQAYAERAVTEEVDKLINNNVTNGAAVVIEPSTGEILALVGSKDWYADRFGKVNVTTQTRQPGSAFKPIIYALAMESGAVTPGTVLHDKPTTFGKNYKPENYDKKFRGNVLPRRALANSLNVPAVEVMTKLEIEDVLDRAREMGITTLKTASDYGPSLVLGTGDVRLTELTGVYATFANSGKRNDITAIQSISNKYGEPIYSYTPKNEQVISPEISYIISSMLSDNKARSEVFGRSLTVSRPAAVKTGTTENYRDALTVGYTPQVAVGVWVGNNDGKSMDQVAGSLGAAPIWKRLMEKYLSDKKEVAFQKPDNVLAISICQHNGLLARNQKSGESEYFVSGTQPTKQCDPRPSKQERNTPNVNDENISEETRKHREVVKELLEQQQKSESED